MVQNMQTDTAENQSNVQTNTAEPAPAAVPSGKRRVWPLVAVAVFIIIVAGVGSLVYSPAGQPGTTSLSTTVQAPTTVLSTTIQPTTITAANPNFSPFLVNLAGPQNALFSLPAAQTFNLYVNSSSANATVEQYGLNFTASFLNFTGILPASYKVNVPQQYANTTSPVIVSVTALAFQNASLAKTNYLSSWSETSNSTFLKDNGITSLSLENLSAFGNASVFFSALVYGLAERSIYFVYDNYTVYVSTFGSANSLSSGYVYNITSQIYTQLQKS